MDILKNSFFINKSLEKYINDYFREKTDEGLDDDY